MTSRNYSDLIAWQKAMDLAESTYKVTKSLPREEMYGLTSQMRRAAVSIPSNIAEGQGRRKDGNFLHALLIAYGSLTELETQVILAKRLQFISDAESRTFLRECGEVGRFPLAPLSRFTGRAHFYVTLLAVCSELISHGMPNWSTSTP